MLTSLYSYSHQDLTKVDRHEIYDEMNKLEYLFRDHLGFSPTYTRLPFLASNDEVLDVLDELKYHVIGTDLDTKDWQHNSEHEIDTSVHLFNTGFNDGHRLVLAHAKYEWTVKKLLPEMHKAISDANIRSMSSNPHCVLFSLYPIFDNLLHGLLTYLSL